MERVNLCQRVWGSFYPDLTTRTKGQVNSLHYTRYKMSEETVAFSEPTPEQIELEQRIELLELSRINIRVSPVVFGRLHQQAEFLGLTIEEHCRNILQESLKTQIGKATITGPSTIGGVVQERVVGPRGLVTRG